MPSPVPFRKVRKQLEDAGWKLVKINGSHHKFKHDDVREHITIPVHKNLVRYGYVRDIEKTLAEQAKKNEGGTE